MEEIVQAKHIIKEGFDGMDCNVNKIKVISIPRRTVYQQSSEHQGCFSPKGFYEKIFSCLFLNPFHLCV